MALGTNYKRIEGKEEKLIRIRLRLHSKRMDGLVQEGMDQDTASKLAYDEVKKMTDKELRESV